MRIEIKDGNFGYTKNKLVLNNINFVLESGKIMTILGRNGIGKTTLLKCLTGILKWDSGQTLLDSKILDNINDLKKIAYVPQAHKMNFPYTVGEMVLMGRGKYISFLSMPSKKDKIIAWEAMEAVGIEDLANYKCGDLSGGQLQLAYIARALSGEPELLVLDEPESHLDFKNQFTILNLISNLVKKRNISCIINTHYPDHALRISDKTLLMGENDYIVGTTSNVITEVNIKNYFGVYSKIIDIYENNTNAKAFVVINEMEDTKFY